MGDCWPEPRPSAAANSMIFAYLVNDVALNTQAELAMSLISAILIRLPIATAQTVTPGK